MRCARVCGALPVRLKRCSGSRGHPRTSDFRRWEETGPLRFPHCGTSTSVRRTLQVQLLLRVAARSLPLALAGPQEAAGRTERLGRADFRQEARGNSAGTGRRFHTYAGPAARRATRLPHSSSATITTISVPDLPKVSGAYISSALAGGATKVPGVVALAI